MNSSCKVRPQKASLICEGAVSGFPKLIPDTGPKFNGIEALQEKSSSMRPLRVADEFDAMPAIALTSHLASLNLGLGKLKPVSGPIKERFLMANISIPARNILQYSDQATSPGSI
jgi:hypothetical protein